MTAIYRSRELSEAPDREPTGDSYCLMCRKALKPGASHRMIHVIEGGDAVLHPEDEDLYESDGGDLGAHPIGPCCARKLGLEWSVPA